VARLTIDELLASARRGLARLHPAAAFDALQLGATLIDIRSDSQIARDGAIPGALVIPRNVLEWRLDPASQHRHPRAPGPADQVILCCDEGYQSSLAAATLQQLGFARATDVEGGFQAWRAAALPVQQSNGLPSRRTGRSPASGPAVCGQGGFAAHAGRGADRRGRRAG
jgi:rhodanese-related sulfurtransferase